MLNVSARSVTRAAFVLRSRDAARIAAVESGKMHVAAAEATIRKERRLRAAVRRMRAAPLPTDRCKLVHGPLTTLLTEPPASVDLICTDPPYKGLRSQSTMIWQGLPHTS